MSDRATKETGSPEVELPTDAPTKREEVPDNPIPNKPSMTHELQQHPNYEALRQQLEDLREQLSAHEESTSTSSTDKLTNDLEGFSQQMGRLAQDLRDPELISQLLVNENLAFEIIPSICRPGLEITTANALGRSGITKYHPQYILQLVTEGKIEGFRLGRQAYVTREGVRQLLERELLSLVGLNPGGLRPGTRFRR